MLHRLLLLTATTTRRAYRQVTPQVAIFLSTTSRPPEETHTHKSSPPPPPPRLTGDEVEETLDPLGRVGHSVQEAVKSSVKTVKEVLVDREDPIVPVAEEGGCVG